MVCSYDIRSKYLGVVKSFKAFIREMYMKLRNENNTIIHPNNFYHYLTPSAGQLTDANCVERFIF